MMPTSVSDAAPVVRVRWFDAKASILREELVEASSHAEAIAALSRPDAVVLDVKDACQPSARGWWPRARQPGAWDVAWWCRELRVLLAAGMTVVEAIDTLRVQVDDPARADLHARIAARLEQGQSLSEAMSSTGEFPVVLVAGVVAGERNGALMEALDDYLRYQQVIDRLKRKLVSAAIYPTVVLLVGLAVVVFLLWFVVPRFSAMYGNANGASAMTGATAWLISASQVLRAHPVLLLTLFSLAACGVGRAWRRGSLTGQLMRLIDAMPALTRRADEFRMAKLYHALALMFRGGYALDDALQRCGGLGLGQRMTNGIEHAGRSLRLGRPVSAAMKDAGLADAVSHRLLQVGERTGNFDRVLQTVAERHAERFTTMVERVTRLAEPLLLLGVALVVGGVVVMMYMPVFDLAGSMR